MRDEALMEVIPEEIWLKILEIGIEKSTLGCSDLCSLSISCKHFYKLSNDDTIWSKLQTLDFPPKNHNDDQTSFSSSKKTLYKYTLERYLKRKIASIGRKVVKDEFRLGLLAETVKHLRRSAMVINGQVKELSGEFLDLIEKSPMHLHDTIIRLHFRILVMHDQMMEFSGELVEMIENRECRVQGTALTGQDPPLASAAAPASATSAISPSSITPDSSSPYADILDRLETKIDHLVSLQQDGLSIQQQQHSQIDILLRRQQEHGKQLAVLTSRLVSLGTGSHLMTEADDDDDDDDDDDNDDDDDDDDDDFDDDDDGGDEEGDDDEEAAENDDDEEDASDDSG